MLLRCPSALQSYELPKQARSMSAELHSRCCREATRVGPAQLRGGARWQGRREWHRARRPPGGDRRWTKMSPCQAGGFWAGRVSTRALPVATRRTLYTNTPVPASSNTTAPGPESALPGRSLRLLPTTAKSCFSEWSQTSSTTRPPSGPQEDTSSAHRIPGERGPAGPAPLIPVPSKGKRS